GERSGGDHPSVTCESGWPLPQHPVPTPVVDTPCLEACKSQTRDAAERALVAHGATPWSPGRRLFLPGLTPALLTLLALAILPLAQLLRSLVESVPDARAVRLPLALLPVAFPLGLGTERWGGQGDATQVDAIGGDAPPLAVLPLDRPVHRAARGVRLQRERVVQLPEPPREVLGRRLCRGRGRFHHPGQRRPQAVVPDVTWAEALGGAQRAARRPGFGSLARLRLRFRAGGRDARRLLGPVLRDLLLRRRRLLDHGLDVVDPQAGKRHGARGRCGHGLPLRHRDREDVAGDQDGQGVEDERSRKPRGEHLPLRSAPPRCWPRSRCGRRRVAASRSRPGRCGPARSRKPWPPAPRAGPGMTTPPCSCSARRANARDPRPPGTGTQRYLVARGRVAWKPFVHSASTNASR